MTAFYLALFTAATITASAYWVLRAVATENARSAQAIQQEIAWIGPTADSGQSAEAGEPQAYDEAGPVAARRPELELFC